MAVQPSLTERPQGGLSELVSVQLAQSRCSLNVAATAVTVVTANKGPNTSHTVTGSRGLREGREPPQQQQPGLPAGVLRMTRVLLLGCRGFT